MSQAENPTAESPKRPETYYSLLGCGEEATLQELKKSYRALIKEYHPDKRGSPTVESDERFVLIDKAYKTLRDDKSRREYDAALMETSLNDTCLIYAEISKNEISFVDGAFLYPCRCGDEYVVTEDLLTAEECVIECSECTNCILIK